MSLCWWASSEAWRVSKQLIALFISSWRCSTSLGKVLKMALGETHICEAMGILVASEVPGMGDRGGEQLVWAMSSAMPAYDDSYGEGGITFRETGSIFSASKGISSLLAVGMFGAMDVGLLGEMPTGSCSELSGTVIDRSSSSISIAILGQETISLGHSVTECRDEIGVKNHWGVILGRFTCKSMGLQVDSMWESESEIGGLGGKTTAVPGPPFRPSGYTTSTPHCRSLQTSRLLRYPHVLLHGAMTIMALMCPAVDRGMCWEPSFNCVKV